MMHQPWDRAQPDEWLPRSLRLCWGGGGDGGGFSGDSGGGGWGGDSGFGGGFTGGGDWGSSGSYDASGFNAGGDLGAWSGTAYDASTAGTGAGGGGDWGSFGPTSYGGMDAPNPTFADIAGPNPGVTSGGGDWGSAGTFSAAGTGGGPGGAMFGADLGAGGGGGGGWSTGDYGGGFTGYDGGGGGGAYTGGGGVTGGTTGGGAFGNFGTGTLGASNAVSSVTGPAFADTAGSAGGHAAAVAAGKGASEAPTTSEAQTESAGPDAEAAPSDSEAAPDAESESAPLGSPTTSESEQTTSSESEAAPSAPAGRSSSEAETQTEAAPAETETAASSTSAFGPQSLDAQAVGEQGRAGQQQDSFDSRFGFDTTAPQDSFDSRFGDWGQQQSDPYAGPFAGPDVVGGGRLGPDQGAPQWSSNPLISDLMSRGPDPRAPEFALPTTPAWAQPQNVRPFELVDPRAADIAQSRIDTLQGQPFINPRAEDQAQARIDARPLSDINTWLSPQNQGPVTTSIFNAITGALAPVDEASSMGTYGGPLAGPDVVGDRGTQNTQDTFDSRFAVDPNTDTTNWGAVFEGAAGPTQAYQEAAQQLSDLTQTALTPQDTTPWGDVFEGAAPNYGEPAWGDVFEGAAPAVDPEAAAPAIEAFIPGGQQTNFEYQGSAAPAETAAQSAAAAAQQAGVSPEAAGAASAAAYAAAARGASPAEQAEAAAAAAEQAGASQQQAMAIASGVHGQAQEGGGRPQSQGTTLGQVQDAVYGTGGPYTTPGGNVYGGHTVADIQTAVYGDSLPGMPTGNPSAPLTEDTSQQSYADTTGRAQSFIPGGQVTNFEYAGSPQAQPQQAPPPSLVEQQQGAPPGQALPTQQPGLVDMAQPNVQPAPSTMPGKQGGIGSDTVASPDDDPDTPEPPDTPAEQDPNAPRPQGNVPGQLIGARDNYPNSRLDNPRNPFYQNSGRTDYRQGRPGVDYRTARQAGVVPNFRVGDYNVQDLDARLITNINRAVEAMERAGIPNTLVVASAYRPSTRAEAAERGMDERTSQESVYARGHAPGGRPFAAARPGGSNHAPGRALDFNPALSGRALTWLRQHAREFGLETLGGNFDIPHIQLSGARGNAGARPSAQEQAEQRAIDAQNRQAAIGQGQAPAQQAGVPMPQARPSDVPQAQPDVAQPQPRADIPVSGRVTFYAPGAGGRTEGKFETSRPNPNTGKNAPSTLDDVRLGNSPFVTVAADPSRYGENVNLGDISYTSPIDGKSYTLHNVQGFVHDTGSAFKGRPDKSDVAVGDFRGWNSRQASAFVQNNGRQPGLPGGGLGIGSDYAAGEAPSLADMQVQPDAAPPTQQAAAPTPPAEIPTALPPQVPQETRPPADIPAPTLAPPQRGTPDPALMARTATQIAQDMAAKGPRPTSLAEGQAAASALARSLARAGIPANIATQIVTNVVREGTRQAGYDPDGMLAGSTVKGVITTALQGYRSAAPGAVQGPPAPEASLRGLAKGGKVAEDEPVVVGEEGPEVFVPDQPGTVVPHMPQPGKKTGNIDRWPRVPAPDYPGRYGGVEREILRQTRNAQDPSPSLMDMIDSGRLPLNEANWQRMISDPDLIALGRARMDDRREGIDPGAEQYGVFPPKSGPTAEPPDPTSPMAQALGYGSIKRRPVRIGRQNY